jgi:transcription elongation factor GreB
LCRALDFTARGATVETMSRAFVKESDQMDALPDIPLSEHPGHITPQGLQRQQQRLAQLRNATHSEASLPDPLAAQAIAREIRWLEARIAGAIVIDPAGQPTDRVAFGATVEVIDEQGEQATYRIVGEDEADAEHGSVSWFSPLAKAVIGAKVGDEVTWRRPAGDLRLEIAAIRYE